LIYAFDRRVLFAHYEKLEEMITISGLNGCALSAFTKSMAQSVGGRQISLPFTSLLSDSFEKQELLPQLIPDLFELNSNYFEFEFKLIETLTQLKYFLRINLNSKRLKLKIYSLKNLNSNSNLYYKHSRNQLWAKGAPPQIFEDLIVGLKG
jgi:hypothetical protein